MKSYSASLVTREMQIEAIMQFYTPYSTSLKGYAANMENADNYRCWHVYGEMGTSHIAARNG